MTVSAMHLLVVDDSAEIRGLIKRLLAGEGFAGITEADSAEAAFGRLGIGRRPARGWPPVDLVLLDVGLPGVDGIDACRRIKREGRLQDTQVVMVTANTDDQCLQDSFEAGATDYITKPIRRVELVARLRALRVFMLEMRRRKARELELLRTKEELEQANHKLARLSSLDGLTGVGNRRSFDLSLAAEWQRARRGAQPLSLVFLDIDYFKQYNDSYGHQRGDNSLVAVAKACAQVAQRSADRVARYGGEELAILLPEIGYEGALRVGLRLNRAISALRVPHRASPISPWLSASAGVATIVPSGEQAPEALVTQADQALYQAKAAGRNRVLHFADVAGLSHFSSG